jgi:hypothetical protein
VTRDRFADGRLSQYFVNRMEPCISQVDVLLECESIELALRRRAGEVSGQ